jgi:hypothetical protein
LKNLPYYAHGLIFGFIAPITVYVTYQDASIFAPPDSVWRLVVVCACLSLVFGAVCYSLLREHRYAGLLASFIVLDLLYIWRIYAVILVAILFAWGLLSYTSKKMTLFNVHLSMIAISMSIAGYFGLNYWQMSRVMDWDETRSMLTPVPIQTSSAVQGNKPDIYYIILDGYGGAEMLKTLHGYDNSEFISELEARGFIVPSKSRANYPRTFLSLSSSLNMQYLDSVTETMGDSYLWWPLQGTFTHNQTRAFLESQGYQTVSMATYWDFTTMTDTDTYIPAYPVMLNKFEELFIGQTNLSRVNSLGDFGVALPTYRTLRRVVLHEFEQLQKIPTFASPKFVFVHIVSPHTPFVFDAQGNSITPDYAFTFSEDFLTPSKYRKGYLEQLEYINHKVLESVDAILESSSTPPIIVIQGDHGPGVFIDYRSADNSCLYERFSILNAYYLPGVARSTVPEDITPVNTFRVIFNEYFSTDLELLPNRQYFSPSSAMYQFEDVTDHIEDRCEISENDLP